MTRTEEDFGPMDALAEAEGALYAIAQGVQRPKRVAYFALRRIRAQIPKHTHVASANNLDTCAECGGNIRHHAHRKDDESEP